MGITFTLASEQGLCRSWNSSEDYPRIMWFLDYFLTIEGNTGQEGVSVSIFFCCVDPHRGLPNFFGMLYESGHWEQLLLYPRLIPHSTTKTIVVT